MSDPTTVPDAPAPVASTETSSWAAGVHPFALAAFGLSLVSLVLAIIIRAADLEQGDFWSSFVINLESGLRDVVWQLAILVLIVLLFAFIRRPDAAVDRFRGIAGRGVVLTFVALLVVSFSGPINQSDDGVGSLLSDAFAESLAGGDDFAEDEALSEDDFDEDYEEDFDEDDLDY